MLFGRRVFRIGLVVWLLAAPGIGVAGRCEPTGAEWGLTQDTRPAEVERGCRVDVVSVKGFSHQHARMSGVGPGLASSVTPLDASRARESSSAVWTAVPPDGRDTHLRLATLLI